MIQPQFKTIPPVPCMGPKQFYRRLENIFQNLELSPNPERFARAFLDRFAKDLADSLRTESIQLYDRSQKETVLIETWGLRLPDFHKEMEIRFDCEDAFPWFGKWDQRMVAVLPVHEKADFVVAFFTQNVSTLEEFDTDFSSYYSALHYSLVQNRKRFEMQGIFEQARSIQLSLLPSRNPSFLGFDIAAKSVPATIVGGDVFDFQRLSLTQLAVTIGDASGHGFVAALQARDVITGLRLGIASRIEMTQMIQNLNRVIHQSGLVSRFVSLVYGELFSDGMFRYINAGHPHPLLFNAGVFTELKSSGMILGPNQNQQYATGTISIVAGSLLLLFTDGVIELRQEDGTEFGIGRLKALVRLYSHLYAGQIVSKIFQDLTLFNPNFQDDVTIICLKHFESEGMRLPPDRTVVRDTPSNF
jgi:serine phosphatase RsbU (regulator of sigma subunit)